MREPEPAIIRAAGAGDLAAFETLVRDLQPHVFRFLRHFLGDAALAEDVTQETFIRAYRRLGGFRFQSRFTTWLLQVARNAATDELRGRQRRDRLALAAPRPAPPSLADARAELHAALASLPPHAREALVLVEIFGFTYVEAGSVLGVPTGTVKSRVFHARARLHAWARAADEDEDRADDV